MDEDDPRIERPGWELSTRERNACYQFTEALKQVEARDKPGLNLCVGYSHVWHAWGLP